MKRTTTLLAAMASAALLLAACTSTTSEEPPPPVESSSEQTTDDGTGGGGGGGGDVPASGEADQATQDYLACLLDHGVDAIIDGEGNIALGAGEQGSVSADDTASTTDETQAECEKAVPEYDAPNYDKQ